MAASASCLHVCVPSSPLLKHPSPLPATPLLQVRTRLAVCSSGIYAGIADCVRQVAAQEGWRAFYRGMVPSMLGILPYAGVDITIFELLKERLLDKARRAANDTMRHCVSSATWQRGLPEPCRLDWF